MSKKTRSRTFEITEVCDEFYKFKTLTHDFAKIGREFRIRKKEVENKARLITKLDKVLK